MARMRRAPSWLLGLPSYQHAWREPDGAMVGMLGQRNEIPPRRAKQPIQAAWGITGKRLTGPLGLAP
jgi:hypothetical protein